MDKYITISNLVGSNNSPFDIYLCESDFTTSCTYITSINYVDVPYTFQIPSSSATLETFGVVLVDMAGCNLKREIIINNP